VATIEMRPDDVTTGLWWLTWAERDQVVARVLQDPKGNCNIVTEGPHWSPMKSFGQTYGSPQQALDEVKLYFQGR
jgi:hypothetical protein